MLLGSCCIGGQDFHHPGSDAVVVDIKEAEQTPAANPMGASGTYMWRQYMCCSLSCAASCSGVFICVQVMGCDPGEELSFLLLSAAEVVLS